MDDALRRTRRNMIGVSVALFLIYFAGGKFPGALKIFNYDIPLSATAFEWLIWIFLIYMCIEYYVHLKSKFPDFISAYRNQLMAVLTPYVEKNLTDKDRKTLDEYRR